MRLHACGFGLILSQISFISYIYKYTLSARNEEV